MKRIFLSPPLPCLIAIVGLCSCAGRTTIDEPLPPVTAVGRPDFKLGLSATMGPGWVGGNKIVTLNNGVEIYPAMLAAIRSARETITFETFVYWKGDTPRAFAEALAERARAGVEVKVIIDAHGGRKSKPYHDMMRKAGVDLALYNPASPFGIHRYNYRTHRKVLVVDGRVGFIGGAGIADEWNGDARNEEEWRDTFYRVEGPVVTQLQGIFADNWQDTKREALQGPGYYPPLAPKGKAVASTLLSAALDGRVNMELMYHMVIPSARRTIYISTPYFVPDKDLVTALADASKRGVEVMILLPGEHIDNNAVRRASKRTWPKLLKAGVRIFEYTPTFNHTKMMIVDGEFVSVGSGNFDPRSLRINDEANLNVLDRDFARKQTKIFFDDLRRSKEVEEEDATGLKELPAAPLHAVEAPFAPQL